MKWISIGYRPIAAANVQPTWDIMRKTSVCKKTAIPKIASCIEVFWLNKILNPMEKSNCPAIAWKKICWKVVDLPPIFAPIAAPNGGTAKITAKYKRLAKIDEPICRINASKFVKGLDETLENMARAGKLKSIPPAYVKSNRFIIFPDIKKTGYCYDLVIIRNKRNSPSTIFRSRHTSPGNSN